MTPSKRVSGIWDRRNFMTALAAGGAVLAGSRLRAASLLQGGGLPPGVTPGDWPHFGYDIRSTRFNQAEKTIGPGNVERLKVKWTFDKAGDFSQSTPIVAGGSLFFAAHDGHVYALDAGSGNLKWKFDAWDGIPPGRGYPKAPNLNTDPAGEMRGSAAYADGRIYIGDGTARFHCLDANSGKPVWRAVIDPEAGTHRSKMSSSPIFYEGKVYVGTSTTSGRSVIACVDAKTGAVRWRFNTVPDPKAAGGGAVWTTAALDPEHGVVYNTTGSVHGHVAGPILYSECMIANDMESGELLWFDQLRANDPFDLDYSCHPILFDAVHPTRGGAVRHCVGAGSKTGFHAFDRYTGERFWTASVTNGGPTLNSVAYGHDKIFMVSNSSSEHRPSLSATVAIHAYTGEILWWMPNGGSISGAVAVANGVFYQGLQDGTLQAIDVENGKPLWTHKLASTKRGGITISNGVVYVPWGGRAPYSMQAFSIDGQ